MVQTRFLQCNVIDTVHWIAVYFFLLTALYVAGCQKFSSSCKMAKTAGVLRFRQAWRRELVVVQTISDKQTKAKVKRFADDDQSRGILSNSAAISAS